MRLLFVGDIIGRPGRDVVAAELPGLRERLKIDFVCANGENAAGGFGINEKVAKQILAAGVDCISGGNHTFDQRDIMPFMDSEPRMLRPLNYPEGTPGRGVGIYADDRGRKVVVINAIGRVFMPPFDDPFSAVDKALARYPLGGDAKAIIVDMHGEATSEKMGMGQFCDGRVSVVVGSHTHVPTADVRIMKRGTAYQTDAGMCGDFDSVIGMEPDEPLRRFTTGIGSGRFQPAKGRATLCALFVETDDKTGLAMRAEPVRIGGKLAECEPELAG